MFDFVIGVCGLTLAIFATLSLSIVMVSFSLGIVILLFPDVEKFFRRKFPALFGSGVE